MHTEKSITNKPAVAVAQAVSGSRGISLPAIPLLQPANEPAGDREVPIQRLKVKLPPPDANDMEGEMVSYDSENANDFLLLQQWVEAAAQNHKLLLILLGRALQQKGVASLTPNEKVLFSRILALGMIVEDSRSSGESDMDEDQALAITPQQVAAGLATRVPFWDDTKRPRNIKTPNGGGNGKVCSALTADCANAFAAMGDDVGNCWAYGIGFGEDEHAAFLIVPRKDNKLTIDTLPPEAWVYDPWLRISCAASAYDGKIEEVKTQWVAASYQIRDTEGWGPAKDWFKYLGGKSIQKLA